MPAFGSVCASIVEYAILVLLVWLGLRPDAALALFRLVPWLARVNVQTHLDVIDEHHQSTILTSQRQT